MEELSLLKIENLRTYFHTENGIVPSVDGVSFSINKGETVAVVGESGSGKSMTALSLMRLIDPPGKIESGTIHFEYQDLLTVSAKEMRNIRGNEISMIFQEPLTSLNPVFTVGNQLSEMLILHKKLSKEEAHIKAVDMLKQVEIPRAEEVFKSYPHSLSGGMRQRVMIAMALSCSPKMLIADEPTTALDVTIQSQILNLMKRITKEYETSIFFITHDLAVVAEMADKVVVMYAGQVVEEGNVYKIFRDPKHPYTKGLLESTPKINENKEELTSIPGNVPNPLELPSGCRFNTRCPNVMDVCKTREPSLRTIEESKVRCWLYEEKEESIYA